MKLVELLAKHVSEWPNGAAYAVQDGDCRQTVKYGKTKGNLGIKAEGHSHDVWQNRSWGFTSNHDFDHDELASDFLTAIVTEEQWQAERDRQKGGEWKRHRGNSQPVDEGTWVEVKLRCGDIQKGLANAFLWRHADCDVAANIMKFRVISQPQAEQVEVKDTTIGTLSYKVELDTSPAMNALNELSAKWDQVESPLKWRDEVTELNAYIEKYTRERDALIERLASEGFALIPPVVSVVSEFSGVDMSDWRNWKVGDIISVTNDCDFADGEYSIIEVEHKAYEGDMPVKTDDGWPDMDCATIKFIRRP